MNPHKIKRIFSIFKENNPSPTTELKYSTPFELLISVLLSAQTTDIRVNIVTAELFKIAHTPEEILKLGIEDLKNYVKSINYYGSKAKHIIKTCEILFEKYNSDIPRTREELESLPGVGRKTANVLLNTLFGESFIAVDTHLFRVCNRTKIAPGKNVLEVEKGLYKFVPKSFQRHAHHWLILHGRYVCKARKPLCGHCMIEKYCEFEEKKVMNGIEETPLLFDKGLA